MKKEIYDLWNKVPGMCEEVPHVTVYTPDEKKGDGAVVIFPGGGYIVRAPHEGAGYAEFLCSHGITAFVVDYRVSPHKHPIPLADARRGVQFARYYASKYGIDKDKIAVMGSSAGGHLSATISTYFEPLDLDFEDDEISKECYIPDAQILCYPAILLCGKEANPVCGENLFGEKAAELAHHFNANLNVKENTPPAFIWHTFDDEVVNVINSLEYAKALKNAGKSCEMHIYPNGRHGLGVCEPADKVQTHVRQWADALIKWLEYMEFTK